MEVGTPTRDYAGIAQGKSALDAYYRTALPPETVAARIMSTLDSGNPPLRLVVGDDTRLGAKAKFAAMLELLDDFSRMC